MKKQRNHCRKNNSESGNMILALFAAVALVGTIGASTTMVMRGPMKVMSEVNQKTMTESQIMLSSKMIMLDTANLAVADCDEDRLNEPRPWVDAAGAGPDGVADSNGGGFLPKELGVSKNDTWGNPYGYCVWDHGALIDDAACGDTTQLRLEGTNDVQYPVIAVISSGANGTFETPCRDFTNADNDSNGSLEDVGDDKLVTRGGDDIVVTYSYAEASKENPSLWELEYDADGNVLAVMDGAIDNVQFTGSNTAFGGNLRLDGAEGLLIPDVATSTCDASTEGQIFRNMGVKITLEICEDTGGPTYEFVPLSVGSTVAPPGKTISAEEAGPGCVPTAKSMSVADNLVNGVTLNFSGGIDVQGDYAFIVSGANDSITSFDISDPNNLVELHSVSDATAMDNPRSVTVEGNYAYVTGFNSNSLAIIDISDPSNMVKLDDHTSANIGGPYNVKISGKYAFVANATLDGITSFDISDPNNIVELGSLFNAATMDNLQDMALSGDYLVVRGWTTGNVTIVDVSDPTNMVELDSYTNSTTLDAPRDIAIKDSHVFVSASNYNGVTILDISNPNNIVERGTIKDDVALEEPYQIAVSGNYLFVNSQGVDSIFSVIDITDIDNPILVDYKTFTPILDAPYGFKLKDNFLFVSSRNSDNIVSINVCAEEYQGQVTVAQSTTTGTTIGSAGWSQTLASDVDGEEAGIAFVVDKNAHKGSAPMAALSAIREGDSALAGLAFKTKSADGVLGSSVYLGTNGRLGLGVTSGDSTKLLTDIQFGDHGPLTWNNTDYLYGTLMTGDSGAIDQIAYFGFEGLNDASNTILFSKKLKIKNSDVTGVRKDEYLSFDETLATTFFGDILQQSEGNNTRLQHKSYSNTGTSDGELHFLRARGSEGSPEAVEQGDVLGKIQFGANKANSLAPTIAAEVVGTVTVGNVPTDLTFKTGNQAQCVQQNSGPFVELDYFDTPGLAYEVWGDGTYIYFTDGSSGVHAFTFNGAEFTQVGTVDTAGFAKNVWGDGTYIYVADGSSGIIAYTFDGSTFTELDTDTTTEQAWNIWGDGTYIYVSDQNGGFDAYSFDGTSFTFLATYYVGSTNAASWGDGTYIYVANNALGLKALTFDGTSFAEVGSVITPAPAANAVWGDGNFIYVADDTTGLVAYDFDGSTFTELDIFGVSGFSRYVWGDGNYIYLSDNNGKLFALSFDGTEFTEVAQYPLGPQGIWGDGTYIYAGNYAGGIRAFSGFECLSDQSEVRFTTDGNLGVNKPVPEAKLHSGGRIRSDEGIMIGNDTTCANPEDVGVLRYVGTPAEPFEVCDGTTWQGLSTYDSGGTGTSDSANCSPISFELNNIENAAVNADIETNRIIIGGLSEPCDLSVASEASSITINKNGSDESGTIISVENGDVVYLKIRSANAEITQTKTYLSLGDKTEEVFVETECTGALIEEDTLTSTVLDDTTGIAIDGDYAYLVSYGFDGIISVDISDPTNLVIADSLSSIGDMGNPGKLTIQGDVAYVAAYGYSRIASIDISDPTNLAVLDSTNGSNISNPASVAVKGNYAFLANNDGVISVDISDPSNMSEVDHLLSADMSDASDIVIIGDHAFVVAYTSRTLTSIDISDPTNLVQVDSTTSPSDSLRTVNDMAVKGNFIFATSNFSDSVAVFDVSDPTSLTEIESFSIPSAGNSQAIALLDNYVYVGDTNSEGIAQIDISDPTSLSEKAFQTSGNIADPWAIAAKDDHIFVGASAGDSITSFKIKCQ